jgi:hypothetical protein
VSACACLRGLDPALPNEPAPRQRRFLRLQFLRAFGLPIDADKQRAAEALTDFCLAPTVISAQLRYDLVRLALARTSGEPPASRAARAMGEAADAADYVVEGPEPAADDGP